MSASPSLLRVSSLGAVSPTLPWSEEAPECLENETLSEAVPVSRLAALPKVCLSPSERLPLQTNGRSHFPLESPPGSVSISTTHRTQAFSSTFQSLSYSGWTRPRVIVEGVSLGGLWGEGCSKTVPGPVLYSLSICERTTVFLFLPGYLEGGPLLKSDVRACSFTYTETHRHTLSSIQTTGTKTADNTRTEIFNIQR